MKRIIYTIIFFTMLSMGISLQIKAGIGQSMFNAFCMLLADLLKLEIGTMINICNLLFFTVYIIARSSRIALKDGIQIIAIMVNGYFINVFTYSILNRIIIQSYLLKVLLFLFGLVLASVSLGSILAVGIDQSLQGLDKRFG